MSIGFLLAAVLWPKVRGAWQDCVASGLKSQFALNEAIEQVRMELDSSSWGLPHRMTAMCREIWQMQAQFDNQRGQRPFRLLAQARFRAAYDFLLLRHEVGEENTDSVLWWQTFQAVSDDERADMVQARPLPIADEDTPVPKKRRRRRKPKTANKPESA